MVGSKCVLVLGAGASSEVGFPLGIDLVDLIVSDDDVRTLLRKSGVLPAEMNAFIQQLVRSAALSIDKFLEDNEQHLEIGKLAIATVLVSCEHESALFGSDPKRHRHWYRAMFERLFQRFNSDNCESFKVITFNYDRSLEYFLLTALQHQFNESPENCVDLLRNFPICHIHGDLGELPGFGEGPDVRVFEPDRSPESLAIAARRIHTLYSSTGINESETLAQQWIKESEYVYFLGFGYAEHNMKKLGFPLAEYQPSPHKRQFRGTVYGMNERRITSIKNSFYDERYRLDPDQYIQLSPKRILGFIEEFGVFDDE